MKSRKNDYESLREIISKRKSKYSSMILDTAERIYSTGNIGYIESFENLVNMLHVAQETGKLETLLFSTLFELTTKPQEPKTAKKKRLTLYQYCKSRDGGMSNEEIKAKFRMDTPYSICGFARQYSRQKKK
jgi:hypothetical protein